MLQTLRFSPFLLKNTVSENEPSFSDSDSAVLLRKSGCWNRSIDMQLDFDTCSYKRTYMCVT